tara:strand:+ start:586 stop:804 length:219 start_codon:yes stop_codon:yes gene_type:complete
MKNLVNRILHTMVILSSIVCLGIFIPLMVSVFISIVTPATFIDCTTSVPFWIVTIIGWFAASAYVNDVVTEI